MAARADGISREGHWRPPLLADVYQTAVGMEVDYRCEPTQDSDCAQSRGGSSVCRSWLEATARLALNCG